MPSFDQNVGVFHLGTVVVLSKSTTSKYSSLELGAHGLCLSQIQRHPSMFCVL